MLVCGIGDLVLLLIVLLYEVLCFALCLRELPLIVAGLLICGVYVLVSLDYGVWVSCLV